MGVPVLDLSCTIMCPHGGQAAAIPGNTRVTLGGAPALLVTDTVVIAGCPFNVSGAPSPCLTIRWIAPATRVTVGAPVLLQSSVGLCLNAAGAPQGTAIVSGGQTKTGGE